MKKFLMIAAAFFSAVGLSGDDIPDAYYHNILHPNSPNAASLGQYGAIPVSQYNGVPNISIPIYEVDLDGLTLPITLSYHASGIKVRQEASWVGLGWALSSGGVITKEVRGKDDFPQEGKDYQSFYDDVKLYNSDINSEDNGRYIFLRDYAVREGPWNPIYNQYKRATEVYDAEPDLYHFNFAGNTGTFFFRPVGSINTNGTVNTKKFAYAEQINVKSSLDAQYDIEMDSWIIKDDKGFIYYFNSRETTETYSGERERYETINETTVGKTNIRDNVLSSTTAWYIDSIVSPKGRKMFFEYEDEGMYTLLNRSDFAYIFVQEEPDKDLGYKPLQTQHYSTMAYFSKIYQKRLTKITVDYDELSFIPYGGNRKDLNVIGSARYLDEIKIMGQDRLIRHYKFDYSYKGSGSDYKNLRLFLERLENRLTGEVYTFEYDSPELPEKHSESLDHWGYFNNKSHPGGSWTENSETGNTTIPTYTLRHTRQTVIFRGADKRVDGEYVKAGMLTAIGYPTGGRTRFEYEIHKVSNSLHYSSGGGVRLSKIYDEEDGSISNVRHYVYKEGKRMTDPCYFYDIDYLDHYFVGDVTGGPGWQWMTPTLYITQGLIGNFRKFLMGVGNSGIPLNSSAAGHLVGYGTVEEIYGENGEQGKIVYRFINEADDVAGVPKDKYEEVEVNFPWIPTTPYHGNGLPLSTEYYNAEGKLLRKVENFYSQSAIGKPEYGFKVYICPFFDRILLPRFYPYQTEWWKLIRTISTEYSESGPFVHDIQYEYEDANYLPLSNRYTDSDGSRVETTYRYPFQIGTGIYSEMTRKRLLNCPIETVTFKDGIPIQGALTTYLHHNGMFLPSEVYSLKVGEGIGFTPYDGTTVGSHYNRPALAKVNRYDDRGNILEYENNGTLRISYLWGYQGRYPIAEFRNIGYQDVVNHYGQRLVDQLYQSTEPTDMELLDGAYTASGFQKGMVSIFSYIPGVGIYRRVDPTGQETYYNYDSAGRLTSILNHNSQKVESYDYNLIKR